MMSGGQAIPDFDSAREEGVTVIFFGAGGYMVSLVMCVSCGSQCWCYVDAGVKNYQVMVDFVEEDKPKHFSPLL